MLGIDVDSSISSLCRCSSALEDSCFLENPKPNQQSTLKTIFVIKKVEEGKHFKSKDLHITILLKSDGRT